MNQERWQEIMKLFPDKVNKRLNDEDDDDSEGTVLGQSIDTVAGSTRPEVKSARESTRPGSTLPGVDSILTFEKINVWSLINENIFSN